jgi:hypothetical protein
LEERKSMKRIIAAICLGAAVIVASATAVYAHDGSLDETGGHIDNLNLSGLGAYHYHHGQEAHLHPNGVCPLTGEAEAATTAATTPTTPPTAATTATTPTAPATTPTTPATPPTTAAPPAPTATASPEAPTVYRINVAASSVYESASDQSKVLTLAPKDYAFTPTGVTRSYWQVTFTLEEDAKTLYVGYVRKSDCAVVTL